MAENRRRSRILILFYQDPYEFKDEGQFKVINLKNYRGIILFNEKRSLRSNFSEELKYRFFHKHQPNMTVERRVLINCKRS